MILALIIAFSALSIGYWLNSTNGNDAFFAIIKDLIVIILAGYLLYIA